MHQGDLGASVCILEEASTMVPEKQPYLLDLCASELLEIYVTLHDLYKATGNNEDANNTYVKAKALLSSPSLIISEEQRNQIENSLSQ